MNLKKIRMERGFSQKDVADHLYCSPVVYSRYENGSRQPSIDMLIKLADFFDVTVDYLVGKTPSQIAGLSEEEFRLVEAARSADARARTDALHLLTAHRTAEEQPD